MFEKLKSIRLHITASAVLTLILGIVLIIYPTETILFIAKAIGAIVFFVGAVMLFGSLLDSTGTKMSGIVVGAIIA